MDDVIVQEGVLQLANDDTKDVEIGIDLKPDVLTL